MAENLAGLITPPNAQGHNTGLRRRMETIHGIKAEFGKRRGMEQEYFLAHAARGVKLRAKYRLERR